MAPVSSMRSPLQIHKLFNTPGTISFIYNSLGFDDEFLRFLFYRNLLDPYAHKLCVLISASIHDSHVALPLAELTNQQTNNLYDFIDSAYDSAIIKQHSQSLGHIPIINMNPRGNKERKHELKNEAKRCKLLNLKTPADNPLQ